ncbi:MAG: hypothetical protein ACYDCM_07310 [Candidatus Acidiferrales bacterium]
MTRQEAIQDCARISKANHLWGFVHTYKALGFNFRFIEPIECVGLSYGRTVAAISPSGHVIPFE